MIDGLEQSSQLMGGTPSRRKYTFLYSSTHLGAVRVGQFKRHIGGGYGGLPGKSLFDIYKDPKEEQHVMVSMLWAWVLFPRTGPFRGRSRIEPPGSVCESERRSRRT